MTNLDILHYFLGLEIWYMANGIFLSQLKYATDLLTRFHMSDCKPSPTPFQYSINLTVEYTTPLVDVTLYRQLV
jgi:hypothetical protein